MLTTMKMKIEELLQRREGAGLEFKRDASSAKGIVEDFVALSNRAGGWIVIGVEDDGAPVGVDDAQGVEAAVVQAIYDRTAPQQSPLVEFASSDDREFVLIDVQFFQGPDPLALRQGDTAVVYERIGSLSVPVSDAGRLEAMRRERRGISGLDQLPAQGAVLEDLDLGLTKQTFDAAGLEFSEAKLVSHELAVSQQAELIPTLAGIILFGKDPRQFVPESYFRAIRYPGTSKAQDALDQQEWPELPLVPALAEVEAFIRRNTATGERMERGRRIVIPDYPEQVLREVLHNTIAHTDYGEQGRYINVSIYSDRLVVESPGEMPLGMSVEQLKEGISKVRNRAIMAMMHALGLVEKRGRAFQLALGAEEEGYPLPEWSQPGGIVRVTLLPHKDRAAAGPDVPTKARRDRRPDIRAALADGPKRPSEIAERAGVTVRTIQRYLKQMARDGEVALEGRSETDPNRRYRLS